MPSVPRFPKPPGTIIPFDSLNTLDKSMSFSKISESIQFIFIFVRYFHMNVAGVALAIQGIVDFIKDIPIPIKENFEKPKQTNIVKEFFNFNLGILLYIGLISLLFIPVLIISGASYIFNFFIEKTSGFLRVIIWGIFYCFVCFILALFSRKRRGESFEQVFIQMLLYPFGVIIFIIICILTFL